VYSRGHADTDLVLCVVHLDPREAHDTTVRLDLGAIGLPADHPYTLHDALSGDTYVWGGAAAYGRLDPAAGQDAHLLHVTR
jgi:starch synthase (maltosyl-transferring)